MSVVILPDTGSGLDSRLGARPPGRETTDRVNPARLPLNPRPGRRSVPDDSKCVKIYNQEDKAMFNQSGDN